eukprot:1169633-Prymnesium_polylepis.1
MMRRVAVSGARAPRGAVAGTRYVSMRHRCSGAVRFSFCVLPSRRHYKYLGLGLTYLPTYDASLVRCVCACPLRVPLVVECRLSPVPSRQGVSRGKA